MSYVFMYFHKYIQEDETVHLQSYFVDTQVHFNNINDMHMLYSSRLWIFLNNNLIMYSYMMNKQDN